MDDAILAKPLIEFNEALKGINTMLNLRFDTNSWQGISQLVKSGQAPNYFPVGTQMKVPHSTYGTLTFDVVVHDYFKSPYNHNAPSMTLLCHDAIENFQFDAQQAFYYAEEEMPAGTYNFMVQTKTGNWDVGIYQFTLSSDVPAGGQLCFFADKNTILTANGVMSYASQTSTSQTNIVPISAGTGGTNIGTIGDDLNDANSISYGSGNYKKSAIRQWLNSSGTVGNVWKPQTKYDRPPSWLTSNAGFMNGLDSSLVEVIGEVTAQYSTGSDAVVNDKVLFPSAGEIFGLSGWIDTQFPYYANGASAIKYNRSTSLPVNWSLRNASDDNHDWVASSQGYPSQLTAMTARGIVPMFNIL